MNEIAIRVEGLSKLYKIGLSAQRHDTLRDQIAHGVQSLFQRNSKTRREAESFWALDDVTFDIKKGEVVGVIGRNGAGKSTLLKVLSRITEPTKGRVKIYGRVSSLLEVGTGFHPELTGRENIFLNGAILGMRNAEINRKFDEIVAFSEIEKFIDTPVKRYSSGMYVRLAFSVAAHLEPEVLIVDEVLAVGDTAFQAKCLGKIGEVAGQGRTVLFVSHNMAAVQHLCQKVLFLQKGRVAFAGGTSEAIEVYMNSFTDHAAASDSHIVDLREAAGRPPTYRKLFTRMELQNEKGNPVKGSLQVGAPLKIYVSFKIEDSAPNMGISIGFKNHVGQWVLMICSDYQKDCPIVERAGEHTFVCDIPSLTLLPGDYKISVFFDFNQVNLDRVEDAVRLQVVEGNYYGGGKLPRAGFVVLKHHWYDKQFEETPAGVAN